MGRIEPKDLGTHEIERRVRFAHDERLLPGGMCDALHQRAVAGSHSAISGQGQIGVRRHPARTLLDGVCRLGQVRGRDLRAVALQDRSDRVARHPDRSQPGSAQGIRNAIPTNCQHLCAGCQRRRQFRGAGHRRIDDPGGIERQAEVNQVRGDVGWGARGIVRGVDNRHGEAAQRLDGARHGSRTPVDDAIEVAHHPAVCRD